MSFLDVLDSIGTGQRAAAPQAQQNSFTTSRPSRSLSNPTAAKQTERLAAQPVNGTIPVTNGTKGKANSALLAAPEKPPQPPLRQGLFPAMTERKATAKISPQPGSKNIPSRVSTPPSLNTTARIPPKGSYAALMADAKLAQTQRAKSEVGLIKHQATSKERLSKQEKKKREEGEKAIKTKLGKHPRHNNKVQKKARLDPKTRPESSYKGTAKPAPAVSSYRGTAGLPSQHRTSSADARHKGSKNSRGHDEYLGTDEEDEGDEADEGVVDGGGYGTDVSSDMEADAFDVEEEESRALREARADDAKEMALENKLKREKDERKRKLEALARKRR